MGFYGGRDDTLKRDTLLLLVLKKEDEIIQNHLLLGILDFSIPIKKIRLVNLTNYNMKILIVATNVCCLYKVKILM